MVSRVTQVWSALIFLLQLMPVDTHADLVQPVIPEVAPSVQNSMNARAIIQTTVNKSVSMSRGPIYVIVVKDTSSLTMEEAVTISMNVSYEITAHSCV